MDPTALESGCQSPGLTAAYSPYRLRKFHSQNAAPLPPVLTLEVTHQVLIQGSDGSAIINPRYVLQREVYRSDASPTIVEIHYDTISNTEVIIKRVEKRRLVSPAQWASARRELEIHRTLHHPNIVDFLDGGETDTEFVLMLEYIPLNNYFSNKVEVCNKPFCTRKDGSVEKFRSYTFDILMGLAFLHANGVIHMDLKPGNLLLKKDVDASEYPLVKICDLGLSRRISDDGGIVIEKKCGTNNYIAPEVRDQARVTTAVDMWCFGVMIHLLAVGFAPHTLRWKPGEELKFAPRYWRKYENTGLTDLISRCLKLDPRERITALQALSHPWISAGHDNSP